VSIPHAPVRIGDEIRWKQFPRGERTQWCAHVPVHCPETASSSLLRWGRPVSNNILVGKQGSADLDQQCVRYVSARSAKRDGDCKEDLATPSKGQRFQWSQPPSRYHPMSSKRYSVTPAGEVLGTPPGTAARHDRCPPPPRGSPSNLFDGHRLAMDALQQQQTRLSKAAQRAKKAHRCYNFLFEATVNFPFGAAVGVTITVLGCVFISAAMVSITRTVGKYDQTGEITSYLPYFVTGTIVYVVIHSLVLMHGVAVGVLAEENGLGLRHTGYCCVVCSPGSRGACCCKALERLAGHIFQFIWATFGSIALFAIYIVALGMLLASTATAGLSFVLKQTCTMFATVVATYVTQAKAFIALGKKNMGLADGVMMDVIRQYHSWNNVQHEFRTQGVGQVATVAVSSSAAAPAPMQESGFEPPALAGIPGARRLGVVGLDPMAELSNGRSILDTLNMTIYDSEEQLLYYEKQFSHVMEFCVDFGNLYDSFYWVVVAVLCILCSNFLIFAVHVKYFAAWNYEAKLYERHQVIVELEEELNEEDTTMVVVAQSLEVDEARVRALEDTNDQFTHALETVKEEEERRLKKMAWALEQERVKEETVETELEYLMAKLQDRRLCTEAQLFEIMGDYERQNQKKLEHG
jgi:hypothetical protein